MGFDGILYFGGVEIINAARTRAYVENLAPTMGLIHRTHKYDTLPIALGHEPYRTPFLDEADWVETVPGDAPAQINPTHGFFGLYPLSIDGLGDSTLEADMVESIVAGGFINTPRDASGSIRVRGLLLGVDMLAVEYGLTWLRNAIKANACAMHGDLCGYSDLRYFLASPDVCDPLYAKEFTNTETLALGPLSPATGPLIHVHGEGPATIKWSLSNIDGVRVRWGTLGLSDPVETSSLGPRLLQRSNYIVNPKVANNTVGWVPAAGTTLERVVADGGTYLRVNQTANPVEYRSNWVPDPSFENGDPNLRGWRGSGDITAEVDVTAPYGTHVAVVPGAPGGNWIETTLLGPQDDVTLGSVSVQHAHESALTLTVFNNEGVEVYTSTIGAFPAGWKEIGWGNVPLKVNYVIRISSATAEELRLDGFLVTVQDEVGPYFDGDTPDIPGFYDYSFDPNPSGASRQAFGTNTPIAVEIPTDAPFGPSVLSFRLRSLMVHPSVTVELVDVDDTVLATIAVPATTAWTRYSLPVSYSRNIRARFSSTTGRFAVTDVLLEAGTALGPYFDGDSEAQAEYTVEWTAGANASISRRTWTGEVASESSEGARFFLEVLDGSVTAVTATLAWPDEISVTDQLEPYDRTLHGVGTLVGVKKIRELSLDQGAGIEVDFTLGATTPYPFSTSSIELGLSSGSDSIAISDDVINYVPNPNPRTGFLTGYTKAGVGSTALAGDGSAGLITTTTNVGGSAGSFGIFGTLTVGTGPGQLRPNTRYTYSVEGYYQLNPDTPLPVRILATGSGLVGEGLLNVTSPEPGYQRYYVSFTTGASGDVLFMVLNAVPNAAGTKQVGYRRPMITYGETHYPYFNGSTVDTDAWDYAWEGTADASRSLRSVHVAPNSPIIDPDLPPVPSPPVPPSIPDIALNDQNEWVRYYLDIPAGNVALWAATVPTLELSTKTQEIRQLRVRFFPNPFGWDRDDLDPTAYCGEFLLSYLPANSVLTVSGVNRRAWAQVAGGGPEPANHLLYGTDGGPMEWPELTCALPYIMTVDIPPTADIDDLEIALFVNRRE